MDYRRQVDLFDPDLFDDKTVTIVGLGNIGSHVARTLAYMGIKNFNLYDFDKVEIHNLSSQAYTNADLEAPKVLAIAQQLKAINPDIISVLSESEFKGHEITLGDILIIGVDSMDARRKIADGIANRHEGLQTFLIDGRIGGNQLEVYMPENLDEWYKTFSDNPSEDPCGGRYIAYVSTIIGGIIAKQVQKHLTDATVDKSIMMDINSLQVVKNFEW